MLNIYRNIFCSLCQQNVIKTKRFFKTSSKLNTFWENDDKGGYKDNRPPQPLKERMRVGLQELKKEIALWSKEVKERFEFDPVLIFRPGEVDVILRFEQDESLKKWIVTSDSDNNEGFSKGNLTLTNQGTGLFHGELSLRIPKDGRVKRAGYCNIRTIRARVINIYVFLFNALN